MSLLIFRLSWCYICIWCLELLMWKDRSKSSLHLYTTNCNPVFLDCLWIVSQSLRLVIIDCLSVRLITHKNLSVDDFDSEGTWLRLHATHHSRSCRYKCELPPGKEAWQSAAGHRQEFKAAWEQNKRAPKRIGPLISKRRWPRLTIKC